MILANYKLNRRFEWNGENINTLIIENPKMYFSLVSQLINQSNGDLGDFVLSEKNTARILDIEKNVEVISDLFGFTTENKKLINGIYKELSDIAINDYIDQLHSLFVLSQSLINNLIQSSTMDLTFDETNDVIPILKLYNVQPDYLNMSLAEKLLLHMELYNKYLNKTLFIILNLKSCFGKNDLEIFSKNLIYRKYNVLLIENHDSTRISIENKFIIDEDLCEI